MQPLTEIPAMRPPSNNNFPATCFRTATGSYKFPKQALKTSNQFFIGHSVKVINFLGKWTTQIYHLRTPQHDHKDHLQNEGYHPAQILPRGSLSILKVTSILTMSSHVLSHFSTELFAVKRRSFAKLNIPAERSTPVTCAKLPPDSLKKGSKAPDLDSSWCGIMFSALIWSAKKWYLSSVSLVESSVWHRYWYRSSWTSTTPQAKLPLYQTLTESFSFKHPHRWNSVSSSRFLMSLILLWPSDWKTQHLPVPVPTSSKVVLCVTETGLWLGSTTTSTPATISTTATTTHLPKQNHIPRKCNWSTHMHKHVTLTHHNHCQGWLVKATLHIHN